MKPIKKIKKQKRKVGNKASILEIIEFNNPVEVSGDGEFIYITEMPTNLTPGLTKRFLQ